MTGTVQKVIVNMRCAFVDGEDGRRYYLAFPDCPKGELIKRGQQVSFMVDRNVARGQKERAREVVFLKDAVSA